MSVPKCVLSRVEGKYILQVPINFDYLARDLRHRRSGLNTSTVEELIWHSTPKMQGSSNRVGALRMSSIIYTTCYNLRPAKYWKTDHNFVSEVLKYYRWHSNLYIRLTFLDKLIGDEETDRILLGKLLTNCTLSSVVLTVCSSQVVVDSDILSSDYLRHQPCLVISDLLRKAVITTLVHINTPIDSYKNTTNWCSIARSYSNTWTHLMQAWRFGILDEILLPEDDQFISNSLGISGILGRVVKRKKKKLRDN